MIRRSLVMLARATDDGRTELRSPAVGIYGDHPREGEGLVPGSVGGTLVVLGRTIDLLVPAGIEGDVVAVVRAGARAVPVAFGDTLLLLAGRDAAGGRKPAPVRSDASPSIRGLGAGEHALRAPTSGVFYARPDPASPPFVAPGSPLETGQTAGLIEVMKCFNPIVHPGGDVPSPAVVDRILVREGDEVRPGQILVVLRAT